MGIKRKKVGPKPIEHPQDWQKLASQGPSQFVAAVKEYRRLYGTRDISPRDAAEKIKEWLRKNPG